MHVGIKSKRDTKYKSTAVYVSKCMSILTFMHLHVLLTRLQVTCIVCTSMYIHVHVLVQLTWGYWVLYVQVHNALSKIRVYKILYSILKYYRYVVLLVLVVLDTDTVCMCPRGYTYIVYTLEGIRIYEYSVYTYQYRCP